MNEQLLVILEAMRAAQCTLGSCRQPNVTVEQLRDILCNARVDRDNAIPNLAPTSSALSRA